MTLQHGIVAEGGQVTLQRGSVAEWCVRRGGVVMCKSTCCATGVSGACHIPTPLPLPATYPPPCPYLPHTHPPAPTCHIPSPLPLPATASSSSFFRSAVSSG